MREDLDQKLCEDFPNLYADRKDKRSCMAYGFDIGDGWEPLVRRLSERIEAEIVAMPPEDRAEYRAFQVKEKFGALRFYMAGPQTQTMSAAIDEAESESARTCEECGKPGKIGGKGWLRCLCPKHETHA